MKHLAIAAVVGIALVGLFAGRTRAQGPAPNEIVQTQFSGEEVDVTDGDDTCQLIGPYHKLLGQPPSDAITVHCQNGLGNPNGPSITKDVTYPNIKVGQSVSDSFTANTHTISWTITHKSNPEYDWSITLDGTITQNGIF